MKKILLSCNGGFSTSILVQSMLDAAQKKDLVVQIEAVPETDVEDYTDWDILLLGPQIAHREEEFSEEFTMPVFVIDQFDYGMMNGESVLTFALENCR